MPSEVADHVAAVAVFGYPTDRYVGMQLPAVSPQYGAKTIDLCASGGAIRAPTGNMLAQSHDGMFSPADLSYVQSGMAGEEAGFAAGRI